MNRLSSCFGAIVLWSFALLFSCRLSCAGPLRDFLMERRMQDEVRISLPEGARVLRDEAYGPDPLQRMDIYIPRQPDGVPVIFMVHGGGWRRGDKGADTVVANKVMRWVSRGFVFVSINYRLLPGTGPLEQAQDVVRALAAAQNKAPSWGGDPAKFILMGHSAGAHLVALLGASPETALKLGVRPWLGTIALDSAAFDVGQIMAARHARLYDQAFGEDATYWKQASPFYALSSKATQFLAVCSTRRSDSCGQAHRFTARASTFEVHAEVLEEDLSHREINQQLGIAGDYTASVEAFMGSLDGTVKSLLANPPGP